MGIFDLGASSKAIASVSDAQGFCEAVSGQVCLKARRGGYDGKGVWFPSPDDLPALVENLLAEGVPLMAEKKVNLTRELSVVCARRPSGQVECWPVTQTVQSHGICVEAIHPAPDLSPTLADDATRLERSDAIGTGQVSWQQQSSGLTSSPVPTSIAGVES